MAYPLPPFPRRRREPPAAGLPRSAALDALAAAKYGDDDLPFGGYGGEMLTARPAPPPPAPKPFVIEPPPWVTNPEQFIGATPAPEPAPRDGLAELKEAAGEVFDPPAPNLEPHVKWQPLLPPEPPPKPDWELEMKEQAERDKAAAERERKERREQVLRELLAEDESAYPKPKGRP